MRHILIPALFALLLPACGKKSAPAAAADAPADEPAAAAADTMTMKVSGDAKAFAKKLVDMEITDFKPDGGSTSGIEFVYTSWDLKGDGSWAADGSLETDFEEIPCKEFGTWTVEDASSASVGTITWTVDKTSCPAREAGKTTRGQVTLGKGTGFSVAFR